jgi:hypothetical protein
MLSAAKFARPDENASAAESALDAALNYIARGWSPIPIPIRSKNPGRGKWQALRITAATVRRHFNGSPQNVGVLLGAPSGDLIDVDLDHPLAVRLADQFLPPTEAVFGRPGNPRSHRIYRSLSPIKTKKFAVDRGETMIVELRSTGTQTVFPPSIHESGEMITWDDPQSDPFSKWRHIRSQSFADAFAAGGRAQDCVRFAHSALETFVKPRHLIPDIVKRYGVDERTALRYVWRARRRMIARSGQPIEWHRAEALLPV